MNPLNLIPHREFKKWLFFMAIIILGYVIMLTAVLLNYSNQKSVYLRTESKAFSSKIEATMGTYELFSHFIFTEIVNQPEILSLIQQANTADPEVQKLLRNRLHSMLKKPYEEITTYNFRQLHFHLANGDSFLRFHAPDKFGDNLLSVRESIRIANEQRRIVIGFEEGKIFNGYRFVYPLSNSDGFLGTVEVSISMSSLVEVINELYPDMAVYFILPKSVVLDTVFEDQRSNYTETILSDAYFSDSVVEQASRDSDQLLDEETCKTLFSELSVSIQNQLSSRESFTQAISYRGKDYLFIFNAIKNISLEPAAYLISVTENSQLTLFKNHMIIEILLVSLLSLAFLLFSYLFILDQIQIKQLAEIDYLTKILSRRRFTNLATYEVQRCKRTGNPFSLIMLDIDFFKAINDKYGHEQGDRVLIEMTRLISAQMRSIDLFSRWGGEEFILLLPHTDLKNALQVSEKIRISVSTHEFQTIGHLSISLGLSQTTDGLEPLESIIARADEALYRAKAAGRNCSSL